MSYNLLNLGCGSRFLKSWTNIDYISNNESVLAYNLLQGIPLQDNHFDAVYHSHILEHFPKSRAQFFIDECYRVLKDGAVLRVVVPDLEIIIKEYIKNLNLALAGDKDGIENYDWIMLELFDQMVRNNSGGDMALYWRQTEIKNEEYIITRIGNEFADFRINHFNKKGIQLKSNKSLFKNIYHQIRKRYISFISDKSQNYEYYKIGKFRASGEIHQWMYDKFSLGRLLKNSGFKTIKVVTAFDSSIPEWSINSWLDIVENHVRKPDSLFMEAIK